MKKQKRNKYGQPMCPVCKNVIAIDTVVAEDGHGRWVHDRCKDRGLKLKSG